MTEKRQNTVLAVTSSLHVPKRITEILRHEAIGVCIARNSAEAEAILRNHPYPIVLVDSHLADGCGFELIRRIKKNFPRTSVAVLARQKEIDSILKGLESGADYYLPMPIEADALKEMVDILLNYRLHTSRVNVVSSIPGLHEFILSSSEDSALKFRSFLDALLKNVTDDASRHSILQAVEELVNNAIEWGNKYQMDQLIRISIFITGTRFIVQVQDAGEGFDVQKVLQDLERMDAEKIIEKRMREGKRPGGIGLRLIKEAAERMTYNQKGNSIIVCFRLNPKQENKPKSAKKFQFSLGSDPFQLRRRFPLIIYMVMINGHF